MNVAPGKYIARHESGSLPACHLPDAHADSPCAGCAVDHEHSRRCNELSRCPACGEGFVVRDRKPVCITAGCAKSTRKVTPPERPKLLQAAKEARRHIDVRSADGIRALVRLERAIEDFEHVRSTAHEEAFADGSLDDDAYAQATSHVLNWVAGEDYEPIDNMLEDT